MFEYNNNKNVFNIIHLNKHLNFLQQDIHDKLQNGNK